MAKCCIPIPILQLQNKITETESDPCEPTYGDELVIDGDFPEPNVIWSIEGLGTYTYGQPGVSYVPSEPGDDGSLAQFPAENLEGDYRVEIRITGRTTGYVQAGFSSYFGSQITSNGTTIEIVPIDLAGAIAIDLVDGFDGIVTFFSVRKRLTECPPLDYLLDVDGFEILLANGNFIELV